MKANNEPLEIIRMLVCIKDYELIKHEQSIYYYILLVSALVRVLIASIDER